jgi:two-component system response regulator MprA
MDDGRILTNWTRKARVLVVDDEPAIQETVAALLVDEGYAVRCASDGVEALAAVERDEFDLVITDVVMPRLDGLGLVRELRYRGFGLPIVLMSATPPQANFAGLAFVAKPFESSRLLGIVASSTRAGRLRTRKQPMLNRPQC